MRSRSHPALLTALKGLRGHRKLLEAHCPISKNRGIFFFDSIDLARPPILRYQNKLKKWHPPEEYHVLVLVPQTPSKPFHRSREVRRIMKATKAEAVDVSRIHFCVYSTPFGVVPIELDEVYPLSQFEASVPADLETEEYVVNQVKNYILRGNHGCKVVVFYSDEDAFGKRLLKESETACLEVGLTFLSSKVEDKTWSKGSVNNLVSQISSALKNMNTEDGVI
jgi:7-cyano-7-deazaguanine tRNA-ribosyltransferase